MPAPAPAVRRAARSARSGSGAAAQQRVYVLGADGLPQAVRVTTGDTNGTLTEVDRRRA